jgi:hypothetical protein
MNGTMQPVRLDPRIQVDALAATLNGKGFTATVFKTGGHQRHPCVKVASGPERHARMTEYIYAAPENGQWWFWWSSLEPIAPVSHICVTADKIARALTRSRAI